METSHPEQSNLTVPDKFMTRGKGNDDSDRGAIQGDHFDSPLDALLDGTAALVTLVAGLLSTGTVKPSAVECEWML